MSIIIWAQSLTLFYKYNHISFFFSVSMYPAFFRTCHCHVIQGKTELGWVQDKMEMLLIGFELPAQCSTTHSAISNSSCCIHGNSTYRIICHSSSVSYFSFILQLCICVCELCVCVGYVPVSFCVDVCTCIYLCMDGPNSLDVELQLTNSFWVLGWFLHPSPLLPA